VKPWKNAIALVCVSAACTGPAWANEAPTHDARMHGARVHGARMHGAPIIETVHIIGSKEDARAIAGSSAVISAEDLAKFNYTDIHRILAQVPGVYMRDEEGYGLRPNISIRGTYGDRSSKITLMEDGVLIAPAPYTASSAYYFPTTGRISQIEVLKGAAAIENGPYTVGGAVNLVSTPIPEEFSGALTSEAGEDNTFRLHAWYGGSTENWGFLLEGHTHSSDGFSEIDYVSDDTGFDKDDLLAKVRYNTGPGAGFYQQLELKLQYSTENSDQTYVGLTEDDLEDDAYRRYGMSREDNMDNEHKGYNLAHVIEFSETARLATTAYYNDFSRNWYKVDKIDGEGINEVITCASGGSCDGMSSDYGSYDQDFARGVLHGEQRSDVYVKNNNRDYTSQGIQTRFDMAFATGQFSHDLRAGARYHEDDEERFQPVDTWAQGSDGSFAFVQRSDASDSKKESDAYSVYLTDEIALGQWTLKPGVRYEDYTINDVGHNETLLGLGVTYALGESWQLLAGVHDGLSPSASADSDPETADNYEFGFRFRGDALYVEAIGFFSDYDNIIGVCTNSGGAGSQPCEAGDTENGGKAEIKGLELLASYSLELGSVSMPLELSYTYTDAEFKSSFVGASVWGEVEKGDSLPNLAENQLSAGAGLLFENGLGGDLRLRYHDSTCATAACDQFDEIDSWYSLDLAAFYTLNDQTRFYVNVDNLTDNDDDIIARQPKAGARAQKPRTVLLGVRYAF
jgi:Fe(3+) dicitrate transport protein